jgi:DMSO reductase anchor subunit
MHPALSVILFSTLSGAGFGLLFLVGAGYARGPLALSREYALIPLVAGSLLAIAGLLASVFHLGHPERAWRAFSQWRSSWLSREGIAAVAAFVPVAWLVLLVWHGRTGTPSQLAGAATAVLSALTVFCTARIYTSLRTIEGWRDAHVLPAFALIGLLTGALWLWSLLSLAEWTLPRTGALALAVLAAATGVLKLHYWRGLDRAPPAATPGSATGLAHLGTVRAFEAPHTERNYIAREMGFVLARRHAQRLRLIALVLLAAVPAGFALLAAASARGDRPLAWAALVAATLGAFVERWLFFAQARHVVTAFYGAQGETS